MDTTEILYALKTNKCTRKYFRGCFAADKLPNKFKKPALFVVNTDESHLPGTHWVSIYIGKDKTGSFFDSFGGPPKINHHINFIYKNCKACSYSNVQIQGPFSVKCGQFSVSYLLHKIRNLKKKRQMYSFLNMFSSTDHNKNDNIIDEMFNVNFNPHSFKQLSKYKVDCNQKG